MQSKVLLCYCLKSQFMIMYMFNFMSVTIKLFFIYLFRPFYWPGTGDAGCGMSIPAVFPVLLQVASCMLQILKLVTSRGNYAMSSVITNVSEYSSNHHMFTSCFIVNRYCKGYFQTQWFIAEITNNMHWFVPLLYSIYWLLHVSAVACHHQGAFWIWVTWNTNQMGGTSYNVWLCGLCADCRGSIGTTHYMIYHPFDLYLK
jgi:hypothetical protein